MSADDPRRSGEVTLREVLPDDLPILFDHQRDRQANRMAAFTSREPEDRETFDAHWRRLLADGTVTPSTILVGERVAGSIIGFERSGSREVTYWIGREYWGRGVATRALAEFLRRTPERPLYARAAKDNLASLRVLEKCGFGIVDEDRAPSAARGEEVEEYVLRLDAH